MPWMPEVFAAPIAETRRAQEEAALTIDAIPYYEGIMADEPDALIRSFAGRPVLDDPHLGHVEGARGLRDFASGMARAGYASATPWWKTWPSRAPPSVRLRRSCCTCSGTTGLLESSCRWPS